MSPDLLRQRRNLIGASLALLFLVLAGAKFTRLSLLGTEIQLDREGAVITTIWLAWLYFLVRYLQYLHAEGDLGIAKGMSDLMTTYARRRHNIANSYEQDVYGQMRHYRISRASRMRWVLTTQVYEVEKSGVRSDEALAFGPLSWAFWNARAFVKICLTTTKGTDFLLPIALSVAALLAGAWDMVLIASEPIEL